jgi:hypothetical protein
VSRKEETPTLVLQKYKDQRKHTTAAEGVMEFNLPWLTGGKCHNFQQTFFSSNVVFMLEESDCPTEDP